MRSGIYQIRNIINGKKYVGISNDVPRRLQGHKNRLRRGDHANRHLQSAFNKHGEAAFVFEIIVWCPAHELLIKEQSFIESGEFRYNLKSASGSHYGFRHTKEAKQRIGKAWRGKKRGPMSAEHRAKLSASKRGIPAWNKGKKSRFHAWNFGRTGLWGAGPTSFKPLPFRIKDPAGVIHDGVNLRRFALERGLHPGHMASVFSGKIKQHKGWRYAA